ncbi:uncharacterized protein [Watersipora subatra]|uniref:uncharacterized protein isoform X2 n=1 Tax=Watersipora subatra TaxID=2589382 RepID=UPI00355C1D04
MFKKKLLKLYCQNRRRWMRPYLFLILLLGVLFVIGKSYWQSPFQTKHPNLKSEDDIAIEEGLIHLAGKLARAGQQSTSLSDSLTVNSAYQEVIGLVDRMVYLRAKQVRCLDKGPDSDTEDHCVRDVTVVASFVHCSNAGMDVVDKFISSVRASYGAVRIIAGVNADMISSSKKYFHTVIKLFDQRTKETDVWKHLLSSVTTDYVYVARDVLEFSKHTKLESLVDSLTSTVAMAVSSATKELPTGQWSDGCYQTLFQNYELKYSKGYHVSLKSCLVCHHLSTPFVTYTKLITQQLLLQKGMTATSGFSIWFLDLLKTEKVVLSFPSSIVHVGKASELSVEHNEWLELVKYHQIEKIYLPDGVHLLYNCEEAETWCVSSHPPGIARSWCCLKQLAKEVQTVMRECEQAGLFCEVTDGTILGIVKFESSLPWEVDGDLELETNNVTKFTSIVSPKLEETGYSEYAYKGYLNFKSSAGWTVEVFYIGSLGSTRLKASGLSVTRALLDGQYITTCESPGLLARNRYGHEIYQHVNHWSSQGAASSWMFYEAGEFAKCTQTGHHACLDQFRADGSTQFWLASR